MKQFYLMRKPMTCIPTKISDYEIVDDEHLKLSAGIGWAGDPGEVLATLIGNDVIVDSDGKDSKSTMEELELIKALRKHTGKNLLQCKKILEELKQ